MISVIGVEKRVSDLLVALVGLERRIDPYYRDTFDQLFQEPIASLVQAIINRSRRDDHLALGEEKVLPDEQKIAEAIAEQMAHFLHTHYQPGNAQRAGNTKTYGVARGTFEVRPDLPDHLRQGIFREARSYPAWVRFAGPGPLAPPDLDDNGILSIGIKVMAVPGDKLLDDEKSTQDFTGISAPTFTTPNVAENLKLQQWLGRGTPVLYFVHPRDPHLLDAIMQGLYARTQRNPLEARYWSCAAYRFGEDRAIQYTIKPRSGEQTAIPRRPGPNYLREAMARTLSRREVLFDFLVQFQTDAFRMPIEDASVVWPERLSPYLPVAQLRLPVQQFDSPRQLAFADNLSFNPWHSLAAHRPLGNQNRARRIIYLELSQLRQAMNGTAHLEPTGAEVFDD
ncbi:MAG TPA: catalase family protein [Chloroflexota bacterium]|nr:catalase family protein [Chloroflexota bacterium]